MFFADSSFDVTLFLVCLFVGCLLVFFLKLCDVLVLCVFLILDVFDCLFCELNVVVDLQCCSFLFGFFCFL